ncbi:MAG: hypothetical protein ACQERN_11865 [Thermodesulfobacteriota bacterium]
MDEWICNDCGFERLEVDIDTIKEIGSTLKPTFYSLPKNWKKLKKEHVKICPFCDAYALGIELQEGFLVVTTQN